MVSSVPVSGVSAFFLIILTLFLNISAFEPPATARMKINMNREWRFTRSDVPGANTPAFNDNAWETIHLPHNFQNVPITGGNYYRGVGWYRKHFTLDDTAFQGKEITVCFEGAMTVAEFWINGTKLTTHYGGFSPFCYDITNYCNFGSDENVIAVRLDNSYQKQVPPEKPDGSTIDFEMYGGIYRDVRLIVTDKVYIPEGIHTWADDWKNQGGHFISFSDVSTSSAIISVQSWVKNASSASVNGKVVTTVTNASGQSVQSAESPVEELPVGGVTRFSQNITVSGPTLWYPWAPYLYTVHTVVYDGDKAVDRYSTRIGIRSVEFTRTEGMRCNGISMKLLGLNRHQTWPFVGHAVPNIQQRRDAEILKDASCNFVRCSHYLQDDEFMNACDSLGILIWVETPGWHCCNNEGLPSTDATWRSRHYDETRFMVRTARNHACVAIWAPAINEAVSDPSIEQPLNDLCHQEDPTRMTSAARAGWQHPVGAGSNIYDIYGDNQFTPGSIPTSNPDNTAYGYINTEHTGHTFEEYSNRQTNSESDLLYHAWRHAEMTAEARDRGAWVHGGMGWCAFDYYTGGSIRFHGVMDLMHYPKYAFWFYKSQSAADNYDGSVHPFLKLANWYTSGSPANRDVYHNCEQVRLYRNGTLVATQGPATTLNLSHGVTTFENIAFEAGMLTAEGLIGNVVVARDTAHTPGSAAAIRLTADPVKLEANGGDFSRVIAEVVDANGTYIPYTGNTITFDVSGPGTLIGDNPFKAQSGVAMNLAKVNLSVGTITVTATSPELKTATVEIEVGPPSTALRDRLIGSGTHRTAVMPAERILRSCSGIIPLGGPVGKNPVTVVIYDLKGRVIYRTVTERAVLDLSKTGVSPFGIRIVKVRSESPGVIR
ncbi:MAG: hypothetical protein JW863_23155 [Chitinispirillaceae bacterium]|nr:hypothetical protein [Chitinispirillaceae bacterium]